MVNLVIDGLGKFHQGQFGKREANGPDVKAEAILLTVEDVLDPGKPRRFPIVRP